MKNMENIPEEEMHTQVFFTGDKCQLSWIYVELITASHLKNKDLKNTEHWVKALILSCNVIMNKWMWLI